MLINESKGRSYHLLRKKGESSEKTFRKKNRTIKKVDSTENKKKFQELLREDDRKQEQEFKVTFLEDKQEEEQGFEELLVEDKREEEQGFEELLVEDKREEEQGFEDPLLEDKREEEQGFEEPLIEDKREEEKGFKEPFLEDRQEERQEIENSRDIYMPLYLQLNNLIGCNITIKTEEQPDVIEGKLIDTKQDEIKVLVDSNIKTIKISKICFIQSNK